MLTAFFVFLSTAHAIPQQFSHQGRLLDTDGLGLSGPHDVVFRIFDSEINGVALWSEQHSLYFTNGFYSAILGADEASNPLDSSLLEQSPLWFEIRVDNETLEPRHELSAVPFARMAETAENIDGGTVDAAEISVNGQLVIDSTGQYVGPGIGLDWSGIQNIPADIADGDSDMLASLACAVGQIAGWDGTAWVCVANNSLTESQVEAFIENDPINLAYGSTVDGSAILTENHTFSVEWTAIQNNPIDVNGCTNGEILVYDGSAGVFSCSLPYDQDADGYMVWDDCNDNDPTSYSIFDDNDCDGILTADDCNDFDPQSTAIADDADCDGILTADDCDDFDANSTSVASDFDCDGYIAVNDCDDSNSGIYPGAPETCDDGIDQDCDGSDQACNSAMCGNILHTDPVGGPSGWHLCFIDQDDTAYHATPCNQLLDGIPIYGDANGLLAAGGNFGCWHGTSGSQEGAYYASNNVVLHSCSDNVQHSTQLNSWNPSDTTLGVCIRYP